MSIEETIVDDLDSEEINYRYEITSYGADYPVDSIIKRIKDEVIFVPPFQREFVWSITQASKFVESLILGLPVPGIFLSKELSTGRLLIVDGQQRLMSLYYFYEGLFKKKEFILSGLGSDLNGRTYKTLETSDRIRLDDAIIHATIVRQEQPDDENSSIYLIFERLNSGGKPLTAQEIRACIYYGDFNQFLGYLKNKDSWRIVFGKENERMKEEELILRFFTLFYERNNYQKPLKGFMNKFMSSNRNFEKHDKKILEDVFTKTLKEFAEHIGNKSFRIGRPFNASAYEACMIGLAERLKKGDIDASKFKAAYQTLITSPEFVVTTKGPTSDEKQLKERIDLAVNAFEHI